MTHYSLEKNYQKIVQLDSCLICSCTLEGKPDSADYFKIPEKFRTAENYEMIEETPFLQNSVNDTIVRGTVLEGESNFRQYNRVKKDTITKFALMHGIGAAEDLSRLTRGLTRRTILKSYRYSSSFMDRS